MEDAKHAENLVHFLFITSGHFTSSLVKGKDR